MEHATFCLGGVAPSEYRVAILRYLNISHPWALAKKKPKTRLQIVRSAGLMTCLTFGVHNLTLTYQTSRLTVTELCNTKPQPELLLSITELLTPRVVENLPPYFAGINSIPKAKAWFRKMVSESRLLAVKHTKSQAIIGFIFIFVESNADAHIGYLIGELYWRKGYATELLQGLIDSVIGNQKWGKLIAGVDHSNKVSSTLLLKLGFVEQSTKNNEILFYEYQLSRE